MGTVMVLKGFGIRAMLAAAPEKKDSFMLQIETLRCDLKNMLPAHKLRSWSCLYFRLSSKLFWHFTRTGIVHGQRRLRSEHESARGANERMFVGVSNVKVFVHVGAPIKCLRAFGALIFWLCVSKQMNSHDCSVAVVFQTLWALSRFAEMHLIQMSFELIFGVEFLFTMSALQEIVHPVKVFFEMAGQVWSNELKTFRYFF